MRTWLPTTLKLALIASIIILANVGTAWVIDSLNIQIWPEYMEIIDRAVLICMISFVVLMAIPFLPGIELGLILMAMLGPKGILIAYLCTLTALAIAFGLGRVVPVAPLVRFLGWMRMTRAQRLLREFAGTPPERRLGFLAEKAPERVIPVLLRRRYLLLALLLNVPGNALIGGGGGIAMMAGASRIYSFHLFLLTISVAVLPGPIVFALAKSFQ